MAMLGKKSKLLLTLLLGSFLLSSCGTSNPLLSKLSMIPLEKIKVNTTVTSNGNSSDPALFCAEKKSELLDLPATLTIKEGDLSNYDDDFFADHNLYFVRFNVKGNVLAGISIEKNEAICNVFQVDTSHVKQNAFAFAFAYGKETRFQSIKTIFRYVDSSIYSIIKSSFGANIYEGIAYGV